MSEAKVNYPPRPLATSREYPGYQFYAVMRLDGHSADACLCYAALTVQNWLCERIQKANGEVPEALRCPPPAEFECVDRGGLQSCRIPIAEILSVPEDGVWALVVREPDPKAAGRSFVTRVGLHLLNERDVEFGVCIDIVDRDPSLKEKDCAYRPQFVRLLFETEGMTLTQVEALAFRRYTRVQDRRGVARLKMLADDRNNQLPFIVFTYAKAEMAPVAPQLLPSVDELYALPPSLPRFQNPDILPLPPQPRDFLPYDAEDFARHQYGFSRVYVVEAAAFSELRAKYGRAGLKEGDILFIEPKAFGGAARSIRYRSGLDKAWYQEVAKDLQKKLQCYSKHKPFAFGGVLFDEDARQLLRRHELELIRASVHLEKGGELEQILHQLEEERRLSAEQAEHISQLRTQMRDEFQKGADTQKQHAEALERQLEHLKADNAELRQKNETMAHAFAEFARMKEIVERVQSVPAMPRNNEDVIRYFQRIFDDRIAFTERGEKSAIRCDINPDMLWKCLYDVAATLADLYRNGTADIERAFKEQTGWELALGEGAQTRKNPELMALRKDIWEGREIFIEPHVKFPKSSRKTGASYQRLYYDYDPHSRRIIVGFVGEHLENFSSLSFH